MKLYTSVALALLSCSDGLHGKYTKCYRGRLGKIPKRQKPLEDLTVQQSAQANEFLKSCNYKFIEKFMKDSKGKPEKRNSVLGAVGLKTAQDWESFTEHNLDDFEDEEVKEDMEKCVSRCNRRDEWADLRGKGYEERLEKHQKNPRRFKKPDFMCSKCISYLSANKLKHVSDLQWGIKPKPSRKTTTTQAPTTTYQPTTFDTTTEKTTTTKKPSRPVTKSKEVKCGLRNRYPLSAQEMGSPGFTNLWDPEYHGQAADKPHRFLNGNIIHGNESKVGEWPWQASFRLPGENQNFCGGSLIDSTTVLTAAHCVHEGNWGGPLQYEFTIALGWHVADGGQAELETQQPIIKVDPKTKKKEVVGYGRMSPYGTTLIKIDLDKGIGEVHAHPDYIGEDTDYDTNVHSPHDIAIVKLPSAVKYPEASDDGLWFNDHQLDRSKPIGTMVRPVCLPSPTSPRKVNELTPFTRAQQSRNLHDTLWITGYGKKEKVRGKQTGNWQINSKHLLEAYLGPISNKLCQREINKLAPDTVIWRKQICAFSLPLEDEPIDTCQGDSGGPLTVRLNINNDLERQLAHLDGMAKYEEMQRMIDEGTVDLNSPDRYELVGITSWGYGCGEGTPGIYTRVSEYMDWIAQYSDSFQTLDD